MAERHNAGPFIAHPDGLGRKHGIILRLNNGRGHGREQDIAPRSLAWSGARLSGLATKPRGYGGRPCPRILVVKSILTKPQRRSGGTAQVFTPPKILKITVIGLLGCILALAGLYAAAGFYLAPYLIQARLLPRLAKDMNIQLAAEAVEFDPFALTLAIRGFSLKNPAGRELIGLGEFSANIDGMASLRERKAVLDAHLSAPTVHLAREAGGKLDLLALVPPDDGQPSTLPPFLLTRLILEQGHLEFKDATGKHPFTVSLDSVNLNLENLGPEPERKARYDFAAKISGKESLSTRGSFSLAPFMAEGKLEIAELDLSSWIEAMAPELAWRIKSGKLGFVAEYRLSGGDKPIFEIRSGEIQGANLEAAAAGNGGPGLKIAKLRLDGFSYAWVDQRLTLDSMALENATLPGLSLATLSAGKLVFTLAEQRLTLESVSAGGAVSPSLNIAKLSAGKLSYAVPRQLLNLESAALENAASPWLKIAKLSAGGLSYDLAEQNLILRTAALNEAVANNDGVGDEPPVVGKPAPAGTASTAAKPAMSAREIPRRVRVGALAIADLDWSLPRHTLDIGGVAAEQGEIGLRRTAEGLLKVPGLPDFAKTAEGPSAPPEKAVPWIVRIGEFILNGYALGFRDETAEPPVRLSFTPAALRVSGFSTEPDKRFQYLLNTGLGEQGKLEVDGQARLFPLRSEMRFGVDKLWLRSLQPYWNHLVGFNLEKGRLNLWGDLVVRQERELSVEYSGAFDIVDLAAVDKREGQDLVRWRSLKFDGVAVGTQPKRASIRTINADQSYSRVFIAADGELNLARDLIAAQREKPKSAQPKPAPAERWPYVIGAVRIADTRMDFSDFTLTPNFATEILNLNGNIRGLSSRENARAELLLEGRIIPSSPVKIYGELNPSHFDENTDIALEFRGVNLTALSPYSSKFAGYRIEKGKLDMDLRYKLKDSKLEVSNRMLLDQLTLGERVESPSATTLPVDFALALLKDSDGKIDIDLPISGDLNDPRFSLGNLYTTAIRRMVTKLVGSPFSLLGNLTRNGGEDLGYVKFRAGNAALDQAEQDKLARIADALKQRPKLNLDIKGSADPGQDRLALAESALLKRLRNDRVIELRTQGQRVPRASAEGLELSDEDYRRLFTRYYRQTRPAAPGAHTAESEPALQGPAFDQAKREVLEKWGVSELELRLLARARGQHIHDYMVDVGGLPDQRIYLLDVSLKPPEDREIKAHLSLSGP